MIKIPFKVSARTARLIGRENIASSKGAIIELVKNAYDADSPVCIVYFDIRYTNLHDSLSKDEFLLFKEVNSDLSLFHKVYKKSDNNYQILENADNKNKALLRKEFYKLNALYIVDAGEGMTQQAIIEHWMTIGTDYKANNIFTKSGRVRAGAKGIGRFALDKLGNCAEMITVFVNEFTDSTGNLHENTDLDEDGKETSNSGYLWKVKWSDFEGDFKTIDSVDAELIEFNEKQINNYIQDSIKNQKINGLIEKYGLEYGTILKITDLRDNWEDFYIDQIYSDLEVLVPPKEENDFNIYLYSSLEEAKYGEVLGSVCDDYDYKLIAKADKNQNVTISVYRNEYDLDLIPPDFFSRKAFSDDPYQKKDFTNKKWKKTTTFQQLLPGFADIDEENIFNDIGLFEFTLYFMKKTYTTSDADKFFYRRFRSNERKDWLDKYSGIKLYRDNFRVRPYGEVKNTSFDWLGLGLRKTQSPAGAAKKGGGYRVNPENIAGTIKISRLTNVDFEDKSSREGLQENKTFLIFKQIIAGIITIFENDRAYIFREMSSYYDEKYFDFINKEKSEAISKSILDKEIKKRKENIDEVHSIPSNEFILAELNKKKEEEIEKLKDEQKVLRGLASSGIVMASFTHELSNLDDVLDSRIDDLKDMITIKVSEDGFHDVPDYLNPFVMLEDMKKQDSKIKTG